MMDECGVRDGRVPLLGQLAGEGWFMAMGEVAATKSLAWLATDQRLRAALLALLGHRVGLDLSAASRFMPESTYGTSSRPDISLLDDDGSLVALIEAKFAATMTVAQVNSYLAAIERLSGPYPGCAVSSRPTCSSARGRAST